MTNKLFLLTTITLLLMGLALLWVLTHEHQVIIEGLQ